MSKLLPARCPHCKTSLKWTKSKTDLFCPSKTCIGAKSEDVHAFFNTLGAEFFSTATVDQLIEEGYDSVYKILKLKKKDLLKLEGFQETKAEKVIESIQDCVTDIRLADLMHASNCFSTENSGLGSRKLQLFIDAIGQKQLIKAFETDGNFICSKDIENVKGLAENSIIVFNDGVDKFTKLYKKIQKYITFEKPKKLKSKKLDGKSYCFTGFRDKILEQYIISNGGKLGSVNKNTTALFCADSSTLKAQKAKELGVKIVLANNANKYFGLKG